MSKVFDYVIIGAGIVGLTIARELKQRDSGARICVLEKENEPGRHSSGRNSGVLHSGIYYPPDSLKAKVCRQGAIEMAEFHDQHQLKLDRRGKILVATGAADAPQLDLLLQRARQNGVVAEMLSNADLKKMEPEARSAAGQALWIPSTAVGSPGAVMQVLVREVQEHGIELRYKTQVTVRDPAACQLHATDGSVISYGHVINAAGLHADSVAHQFGIGKRYTLLPFKGLYWKLDPASNIRVNHLIYPVPDLRVPFLGVHTTTTTDDAVYLGPTAVPAFGRENYSGLNGVTGREFLRISGLLVQQVIQGHDGFRRLAWQEGRRYFKPWFAEAARGILPNLKTQHLLPCNKVGIRAQMLDRETGKLVTDFLVEKGPHSTHILNAISPAWTSAFPFARHVCDHFIKVN